MSAPDSERPPGPEPDEATADAPRIAPAPVDATGLVGSSLVMQVLREEVRRFAPTGAPVVILGETGTGKELVARALHRLSPRAARPFVAANVAAIDTPLLASELFGHDRGAFTGAHRDHLGLFEQAHGGTLFLDEVGELGLPAQAALLRVLERGEVRRVGAERLRRVDVRLVVATNRDLRAMVDAGLFRADLFHRIATLMLRLPPLRERRADLPELVRHLSHEFAGELGPRRLDLSAIQTLAAHDWPGNVRELRNVLRRAATLFDTRVLSGRQLHEALGLPERPRRDGPLVLDDTQVLQVIERERGNLTRSARILGIARSTLRDRLRRVGLARAN